MTTPADADAHESRAARDYPIRHPAGGQHEHALTCTCPEHRYEDYTPGDGS